MANNRRWDQDLDQAYTLEEIKNNPGKLAQLWQVIERMKRTGESSKDARKAVENGDKS